MFVPFFITMILTVKRESESNEWTQGKAYIDDVYECYTLEDQTQIKKVMHETRIPAGAYKVKLREFGGHHEKYKLKFPDFHKGMLWLQEVPGFKDILIHIGNTDDDSSGCILVGKGYLNGKITESTKAYISLYKKVVKAASEGNLVVIVK